MLQHGVGHHEGNPAGELALGALQLAHKWADNVGDVVVSAVADTVLVAATLTPKVTGKFRVTGTVVFSNNDTGAPHSSQLTVGHAPLVHDYDVSPQVTLEASSNVQAAVTFEYTASFPLGVPVTIELIGHASPGSGGNVVVQAHGAQITVEEMAN